MIAGQSEQLAPSLERKSGPGRVLKVRRDDDQPDALVRQDSRQGGDIDPVFPHGRSDHSGAAAREHILQPVIHRYSTATPSPTGASTR